MAHYVTFVHGIGEQPPGSYDRFGEAIRQAFEVQVQKLGRPKPPRDALVWDAAYWADVTQPDQQELKRKIGMGGRLREFMIGSLGDVIAYSRLPNSPGKYGEVQKRVAEKIRGFGQAAAQASDTRASLTVVAHSLGTVIASDGIYDLIKRGEFPQNLSFDRFFTMGSPVALFGLRYGLGSFDKPLRPGLWVNIRYPQDLIGYPLKPLNSAYESAVTEDLVLSPGGGAGFLRSALKTAMASLPLAGIASHSWYFGDRRVIDRIAAALAADY